MEPADVVRRYLKTFETGDMTELAAVVAEDVEIWGAGNHVRGRSYPEGVIRTPGLTDCRLEILELYAADDRVTVYFRLTYRHERTGQALSQTGLKMYQVADGRIVRFWGETDLHGLLRQLGKVPAEFDFS